MVLMPRLSRRTVDLKTPAEIGLMRAAGAVVAAALAAVEAAAEPGVTGRDLDALAERSPWS